jgi:hypothetical protein
MFTFSQRYLLLLAVLLLSILAANADEPRTFHVNDGAFPWYDRTTGDATWKLEEVPQTLKGTGPLPQQSCTNRTLEYSGNAASITIGVFEGDVPKLLTLQPKVVATGEGIAVSNPKNSRLKYRVYTLVNPPQSINGKGFAGGLLLLKVEKTAPSTEPKDTPSTPPARSTPPVGDASKPETTKPKDGTGGDVPGRLPYSYIPANEMPAKEKLHIYILMGQSNMVGRDTSTIASQTTNPRVIALGMTNEWFVAREPMQFGGSGVGPGIPFALEMLKSDPTITIGLVPCAVGGTPLSRWVKGTDLYEQAVRRAKFASKAGVIKGVLWHQGEQDSLDKGLADSYGIRLAFMLAKLQSDLEAPNLPIVVGQLGDFLSPTKLPYAATVRAAIAQVAEALPDVALANAAGLGDKGDSLHFSAAAQSEFGLRYAAAMLQLQKEQSTPKPKRTYNELETSYSP